MKIFSRVEGEVVGFRGQKVRRGSQEEETEIYCPLPRSNEREVCGLAAAIVIL